MYNTKSYNRQSQCPLIVQAHSSSSNDFVCHSPLKIWGKPIGTTIHVPNFHINIRIVTVVSNIVKGKISPPTSNHCTVNLPPRTANLPGDHQLLVSVLQASTTPSQVEGNLSCGEMTQTITRHREVYYTLPITEQSYLL